MLPISQLDMHGDKCSDIIADGCNVAICKCMSGANNKRLFHDEALSFKPFLAKCDC